MVMVKCRFALGHESGTRICRTTSYALKLKAAVDIVHRPELAPSPAFDESLLLLFY
jgi:hypothetical protein